MDLDELREYVVILNGGSGCIVQPMDPEYTYVLTAKHVMHEHDQLLVHTFRRFYRHEDNWVQSNIDFGPQPGINYFEHPDRDIAILKLPRMLGFEKITRTDALLTDNRDYILCGYPESRRNPWQDPGLVNSYRANEDVRISNSKNNGLHEAIIPGNPMQTEIVGQSGGAIGKIVNGRFLLAGIQNKMVDSNDEQMGAVEFSTMRSIDALIEMFPGQLTTLLPHYMGCFSFLKNESFLLEVSAFDEGSISFTRNFLRDQVIQLVGSAATPVYIRNFFNKRLLLNEQRTEILDGKEIWIAWLEFLIILNVVKYENFGTAEISEIFDSFRLLFSDVQKDWSFEAQNMMYADYRGLKNKGMVIISTPRSPVNGEYEIQPRKVIDLKRVQVSDQMKTDEGIKFPFDHYKFVHLDFFKKKCIVDKVHEYHEILDEELLLTKLREEYAEYIA